MAGNSSSPRMSTSRCIQNRPAPDARSAATRSPTAAGPSVWTSSFEMGRNAGPSSGAICSKRRHLVRIAEADRHHILDPRRRAAAYIHPRRRAAAERHRQRHVRRLTGRRRDAVRQIEVPVEVRHRGAPEDVASRRQCARQHGAAAADQERTFARRERRSRRLPDRGGRRQHVGAAEDAGHRIPNLAADPDVQIAGVRARRGRPTRARATSPDRARCRRRARRSRSARRGT